MLDDDGMIHVNICSFSRTSNKIISLNKTIIIQEINPTMWRNNSGINKSQEKKSTN